MKGIGWILQQIHERSLWQLLGSYAVGAWIVLQLAEVLSSLIGLPLWFGPAVIVLLAAGLAVVLLTALVQSGIGGRRADGTRGWIPRTFTWRNALRGAAVLTVSLVVATGGYMVLRAAGVGPAGTLMAKGVFESSERLVLADFENRTSDSSLGETVTALLRIDLAQSPSIELLEPVQLAPVLARMQRDPATPLVFEVAHEVARREGLKALIAGEVLPLGSGFILSARVVAVTTGESLAVARASVSGIERIPDAVDRLSADLRERIGESLRTIRAEPALEQVTTASIEALHDYALAEVANNRGDFDRAIALLQAALDKDSTFAMAHRKMAVLILNRGRGDVERAYQAFTRAFELRDRLTERERHLTDAAYYTYVADDVAAAQAAYEAVLARYATDRAALNNLAISYLQQGRVEDAERLYTRSIDLGGAPAVTYMNAIEARWLLGWSDSAQAALHAFASEHPENPFVELLETRTASATFDYATAEPAIRALRERVRGNAVWEAQTASEHGHILLVQGRMEESLREFQAAVEMQGRVMAGRATPWDVVEPVLRAFAAIWYFDDPETALRLMDAPALQRRIAGLDPVARDYLRRVTIYARAGRPAQARALLAAYESEVPEADRNAPGTRWFVLLARGEVAEAEDRLDDAIESYRDAARGSPECVLCGLIELATLYDRAGQADSAIAVYERYLSSPVLDRLNIDSTNLWRVWLRLGMLYAERGERDLALANLSRLLDLWSHADAQLQPRVQEVRELVARLSRAGD